MAEAAQLKNIIVFGATGLTGLQIVKKALKESLQVTAFVRTPEKLPKDVHEKLHKVIQGDVLDKQKVEAAMEGNDAVLSAVGDGSVWGKGTVPTCCQNILDGMKKHGVKKLVIVGAAEMFPEKQNGIFYNLIKRMQVAKDHLAQMDMLDNEKQLDWVMAMPPAIVNSPTVNPDYLVQKDTLPGGGKVTAAELADFMVNVVIDPEKAEQYKHCKVGISSHPKKKLFG